MGGSRWAMEVRGTREPDLPRSRFKISLASRIRDPHRLGTYESRKTV
jgi:hypothetical protein